MKKLKVFFITVLFIFLNTGVFAQTEDKNVVILRSKSLKPYETVENAFTESLIKGNESVHFYRFSMGDTGNTEILKAVRDIKADLIFSIGNKATEFARDEFSGVPSIFSMIFDPERNGFAPPGVTLKIGYGIKFQYIKKVIPQVQKVGIIYSVNSAAFAEEAYRAGQDMGIDIIIKEIDDPKYLLSAFSDMSNEMDCFMMLSDPKIYFPQSVQYLLQEGIKREIPIVGLSSVYAKAGAAFALDCDYTDMGIQSAEMAADIFSGVPVEQMSYAEPRKVNLSVNAAVAQKLGNKVSSDIKQEATEVFGL